MYDSSAKIPSGILNGNINQLGDFDMCLSAVSDDRNVNGQYCLTSVEVQEPHSAYLAGLHKLMQSHYHFRSKLEDVCMFICRFAKFTNMIFFAARSQGSKIFQHQLGAMRAKFLYSWWRRKGFEAVSKQDTRRNRARSAVRSKSGYVSIRWWESCA